MKKPVITICSSANFYREVVDLQKDLEELGFEVLIPFTAERMKAANDFEVSRFKPVVGDYKKKAELMRGHFDKVDKGDIILVVNNEKHGVPNYIGGNVLMEMTLAFHRNKPIYLLNEIPSESFFLEEIIGLQPVPLRGNIKKIEVKNG